MTADLNQAIAARGRRLSQAMGQAAPSVFDQGFWMGKVLDWAMQNEDFKVALFRFADVLPTLESRDSVQRHLAEYFGGRDLEIPAVLRWGAEASGKLGGLAASALVGAVRSNMEAMASQFVIGRDQQEALAALAKLRKAGFAFAIDLMGEATLSEAEADHHLQGYLALLDALAQHQDDWPPLEPGEGGLDWGAAPKICLSIKTSAFYSQARPAAPQDSLEGVLSRLRPLYRRVIAAGGLLTIDMEQHIYKDLTIEAFKQLRADPEFKSYPHLWLVQQAYLRDSENDLDALLAWARRHHLPLGVRLVKGAYWDYETTMALQHGWRVPVWSRKEESDAAFERMARLILENADICCLATGSHNLRSLAMVMETAEHLKVDAGRYEFQMLYGMAEPLRQALLAEAGRVRLYCPYGEPIPGMAYLVRRLLENTANESFLRQSFVEGRDLEELLQDPAPAAAAWETCAPQEETREQGLPPFSNHPLIDFTAPGVHQAFGKALARVSDQAGQTYPLYIGGQEITTEDRLESLDPAAPAEAVGRVCQASQAEVDAAIAAARRAFPDWRDTPAAQRAEYLLRVAELAREEIYHLAATQTREVGKQWDQAYHDVGEAVDFLEYYAREMLRLETPRRLGRKPGEVNRYFYQPRGLAAVISPWNFPLAIPCGMVSAALVTGNCVIFKPSGLASVVGAGLVRLFREAGLPPGVLNFCPGRGSQIGDYLVEHPDVSLIAFTGSAEVGLRINQLAARPGAGQDHTKRVIAEMGGKNAVIIDDDADLDQAVPQVLASAFGFQGQKCSACSRVIVLQAVYQRFVERLLEAARSLKIGPASDPANFMGPVVDHEQQQKVLSYVELAAGEGRILLQRETPGEGYYAPLTIVGEVDPDARIAQEEIFGPVLSLIKAADFDQALAIANATRQALTGGVFSRSPRNLERAAAEFRVGNLYLNRGITGAMVGRQPFGGFKLSGMGFKAGGPDYLRQFMESRVVTENTVRRGFAPITSQDEWVC